MASIVPKIKIGLAASRREKHNLSFDCSTTANIGSIQPTMCREMVPNSKYVVKVASLVRLASMPVPTFGRMSLRHYHAFVPYVDLWQPFDAMMSGQHYKGTNSASFIPSKVPFFTMASVNPFIRAYSDISIAPADNAAKPYTITESNVDYNGKTYDVGTGDGQYSDLAAAIKAAQAADLALLQTAWNAVRTAVTFGGVSSVGNMFPFGKGSQKSDDYGVLNAGGFIGRVTYNTTTLKIGYTGVSDPNVAFVGSNAPITAEGADLITEVTSGSGSSAKTYVVYFKFKPFLKRLRTIFIGLGYQFSPYNALEMSALKLLAYYKAWFNLFSPVREKAFVDTDCYYLIKRLSELNGVNVSSGIGDTSYWQNFLRSLASECYYYLPMDYYSMSVLRPQQSNQDTDFTLSSGASLNAANANSETVTDYDKVSAFHTLNGTPDTPVRLNGASGALSPMTMKLAFQMLRWANKNTVVGRSIREYLKVHFGVSDTNAIDDGGVYRIGSSRTNIQISDVMSTAESQQGYLGEYGGKGIGYGDSEKFDFTADKFGVWLTLTAVVPESGYYQGYLKENRHLNRYQFFNPEFDALGYQVLERGEVMDDYNCDGANWNPATQFDRSAAFGLVPRYSEYKVGRNIVNGDLSLIGLYNSMSPYTLDRRIPGGALSKSVINLDGVTSDRVAKPDFVPTVVYDAFRRVDPTDHLGQYNRIFNYVTNDLDHFIINSIFDVTCYAPMKSLSDSFDTIDEGEKTIDVTHS